MQLYIPQTFNVAWVLQYNSESCEVSSYRTKRQMNAFNMSLQAFSSCGQERFPDLPPE